MPSFSARGITATLSIAPLQDTLSDSINLAETAQQEKRVKKAFDAGQKLRERPIGPIGPNGKTPGVLQYLGPNERTPFLMAEASERMRSGIPLDQTTTEDESYLTALDGSPEPQLLAESSDLAKHSANTSISLDQEPQALMLTVATSTSSHIKSLAPQRGVVRTPDLKIEVFFNGTLIGSEYINPRRANVTISTNKQTFFSGVRIHRQVEKPWVYRTVDTLVSDAQTAQCRWDTIGAALKEEALDRGVDKDGNGPPSAAFLSALSTVPLPEHVKDASHLAVIDVVVSTGSGKKYGSVAGFVLGPLRMESNKFKSAVVPSVEEASALDRSRSTSPNVLLAQHTGESPNKKAKQDSAQPPPSAMDSPMSSPPRNEITMQDNDCAEFAIELGAVPTGRLVKQIAPSLPFTPSTRPRPKDAANNGKLHSPIKLKLSATRGTAKSWIKDPLAASSDSLTGAGQSSEPLDAVQTEVDNKTSRSVKGDPFTDEEALKNFQPPILCEGSAVTFAGAGQYRLIPRWRPGYFDEEEVVGGMRIVVT